MKMSIFPVHMLLLFSMGAQAGVTHTSRCENGGYRYLWMESRDGKIILHGCKRIQEPASRPLDCSQIGAMDTGPLLAELQEQAKPMAVEFIKGFAVGLFCSLAGHLMGRIPVIRAAFRVHKEVSQETEIARLQSQVPAQRALGEPPAPSGRPDRAREACHEFFASDNAAFRAGIREAVQMNRESMGLIADARLVRSREQYDQYMANATAAGDRQAERIRQLADTVNGDVVRQVTRMVMQKMGVDLPVGYNDRVAVVSPDQCIPAANVEAARAALSGFTERARGPMSRWLRPGQLPMTPIPRDRR